jgi:hypothetical protein
MDENILKVVIESQAEKILYLSLEVVALRTCILNNGLISQDEYNAAIKQVHHDAEEQLEALRNQFESGKRT